MGGVGEWRVGRRVGELEGGTVVEGGRGRSLLGSLISGAPSFVVSNESF